MAKWLTTLLNSSELKKQKALTQYWKNLHDEQIQAHQNTILVKDKAYKDLKALYDALQKQLKSKKETKKGK